MTLSRGFSKKIINRTVLAKALTIMLGSPACGHFHLGLFPLSQENAGGGHGVQEENGCLLYNYRPDPKPPKSPKPHMAPNPTVMVF